jgi:hypothetical protein
MLALQATRWQGKDIMGMSHTHFYSGKIKGTREFGVAFVVVRTMNRNVLDFKAVDKRLLYFKDKNKISYPKLYKCTFSYKGKG